MEPAGPCPLLVEMSNPRIMADELGVREGSFLTVLSRGQRVVRVIGSGKDVARSLISFAPINSKPAHDQSVDLYYVHCEIQ